MKNYLLILLIFVFLVGCEKPVEDAQKSYDNKDYKGAYDHLRKIETEDDVGEVFDKKQKLVLQIIEDIKEKDFEYTHDFFKLLDENNENYSTIQNKILSILKKDCRYDLFFIVFSFCVDQSVCCASFYIIIFRLN